MSLLEKYKRSFDRRGNEDNAITGPATPGTYLGNTPGPIPPKPSPIRKEYTENRENQLIDGTLIDGGSTTDPESGFTQIYSSENPYYSKQEGIIRATNGESPLTNTLKTTGLDVENPEAGVEQGGSGGPNRTAAANGDKSTFLDGGNYKNLRYPTRAKFIDNIEGEEDAGTLNTVTLQQYTPNRTYLEILADPSLEIEAVVDSNNQQPAEGGVPSSVDESIVPKDTKPAVSKLKNFNI